MLMRSRQSEELMRRRRRGSLKGRRLPMSRRSKVSSKVSADWSPNLNRHTTTLTVSSTYLLILAKLLNEAFPVIS